MQMADDQRFNFDYADVARQLQERVRQFLPILQKSSPDDYAPFARAYCATPADDLRQSWRDQLAWIDPAAAHYKSVLTRVWDNIGPW